MKRTCKITNPKLTDDEIEQLVENNQIDENAYKNKILTKSQESTLNTYYEEAVETRRDVLMIEASLIELQDMFIAMAQLVAEQDDLIDNVENNVHAAETYIKKGIEHLKDARQYQEKSRCVSIIIIIVLIIVLIAGILIAAGVTSGVVVAVLKGV